MTIQILKKTENLTQEQKVSESQTMDLTEAIIILFCKTERKCHFIECSKVEKMKFTCLMNDHLKCFEIIIYFKLHGLHYYS